MTGQTPVSLFVYDAAGKEIAEYSTIIANSTDAKVSYLTSDQLGSPRINTDQNGAVTARHDYMPFGDQAASVQRISSLGYHSDSLRKQFTGYERDDESELDFAQARYHDFNLGRFSTPDPLMASGKAPNPQTWNRYIYAGNCPLSLTDPTGLTWFSQVDENGTTHYKWFTGDPGEGWNRVTTFTYDSQSEHGWVALDPLSSNWTDHHQNQEDAAGSIAFEQAVWNMNQFVAGMSDSITSARTVASAITRNWLGIDDNIATSTGAYNGGWWTGFGTQTVAGFVVGGGTAAENGLETAAEEGVTTVAETGTAEAVAPSTSEALTRTTPVYTNHAAAERMGERGITDSMVKAAIRNGSRFWDPKNKSLNYVLKNGFVSGKDLLVGTNAFDGAVTTVIRGSNLVRPRFLPVP